MERDEPPAAAMTSRMRSWLADRGWRPGLRTSPRTVTALEALPATVTITWGLATLPIRARRTAAEAWAGVRPSTRTSPAKGTGTAPLRFTTRGGRVWFPDVAPSRAAPLNRPPPGSKTLTDRVSPTPITSVGASLEARARLLNEGGGAAFSRSLRAKSRLIRA